MSDDSNSSWPNSNASVPVSARRTQTTPDNMMEEESLYDDCDFYPGKFIKINNFLSRKSLENTGPILIETEDFRAKLEITILESGSNILSSIQHNISSAVSLERPSDKLIVRRGRKKLKVEKFVPKFQAGELVFAHMSGYCPWPAVVVAVKDIMKNIEIRWFGTGDKNVYKMRSQNLQKLTSGPDIYSKYMMRKGFAKAYTEMELVRKSQQ